MSASYYPAHVFEQTGLPCLEAQTAQMSLASQQAANMPPSGNFATHLTGHADIKGTATPSETPILAPEEGESREVSVGSHEYSQADESSERGTSDQETDDDEGFLSGLVTREDVEYGANADAFGDDQQHTALERMDIDRSLSADEDENSRGIIRVDNNVRE
jgi:hypothetical protein